ncbi:MAG: lamin tail domain-containing protein, partial [Cellulomonadaceae bacterium]
MAALTGTAMLAAGLSVALPAQAAVSTDAQVIINEVYGGGGNSGATYTHDFIELYNTGDTAVNLSGWSVQYASAAGTNWSGVIPLTGQIAPGAHYLVQGAAQTPDVGTPLPAADASGTVNLAGANGNVALASDSSALT